MAIKLYQLEGRAFQIDLIRTVAIITVVLLHASGGWIVTTQQMSQMTLFDSISWATVDIYQTLGRLGVPLFLMLTGALLLQPSKSESLRVFFKKRWARIGLPFIFWGAVYFAWAFLVIGKPCTYGSIIQGILNGPYTQFWYLYVLVGLYLLTPVLRIFLAQASRNIIKYFLVLAFSGFAIMPIFGQLTQYTLNNNVFVMTGYVGYFVLGMFLFTVKVRRALLVTFLILGIALTAVGTYVLAITVGGAQMYFFLQYFTPNVLLMGIMAFLLILSFKQPSAPADTPEQAEAHSSKTRKLIKVISENTLPIFLFHVIVLESIERGYLGFTLNRNTLNPIIEVPLMTIIVLFVSLAIVVSLKKVPYLARLIG